MFLFVRLVAKAHKERRHLEREETGRVLCRPRCGQSLRTPLSTPSIPSFTQCSTFWRSSQRHTKRALQRHTCGSPSPFPYKLSKA